MNPLTFFRSQLFVKLPIPTTRSSGQTVIVTGANAGIGLEAAWHFVHLDASKVILAVRSISKGEAAAKFIEESTGQAGMLRSGIWISPRMRASRLSRREHRASTALTLSSITQA
jgi:retinol dehydrogenase 12